MLRTLARRDVYAGAEQVTIVRARGGNSSSGLPERARDVTLSVKSSKTLIYAECASAQGGRTATGMRRPVAASMPERQ
jgi:hypothetical protein